MTQGVPPTVGTSNDGPTPLELARTAVPALRPDKPDYYFDFYHRTLQGLRGLPLNILEVGVQKGGSTLLWANYFPHARVLGVDIDEPPAAFREAVRDQGLSERVSVAIVSQDDVVGLTGAIQSFFGGAKLDLVIDDASHYYAESRSTFQTVFGPWLRAGGTYVIEDWGCGYWPHWYDGDRDGHHGLPRLIKELVDLVAYPDRTKLWGDQRTLPVEAELPSPISQITLLTSIAALVRSDAPMPEPELLWPESPLAAPSSAAAAPVQPRPDPALGLRALLRLMPATTVRAVENYWRRRSQR